MGMSFFGAFKEWRSITRVIANKIKNAPIDRTCAKRKGEIWSNTIVEITPLKEKTNAPITR